MLHGVILAALLVGQTGEPGGVVERQVVTPEAAAVPRPLRDAAFPELLAALGDDGVAGNAEAACRELLARGDEARPLLYAAVEDTDPQRRFLAAWALAFVGPEDAQLERVCRTLIPLLGDDRVPGNGLMAGEALRALDRRARPWLMAALRREQGQVREGLLHLTDDRYPYRRTTAYGQQARPVFLLGPNSTKDWAKPRLSAPEDAREERIAYLVQRLGEPPQWWAEIFVAWEIRMWHADHARGYLAAALTDPDSRVRFGAARLLLDIEPDLSPSPSLVAVCLEGLAEDGIRGNAAWGVRYLVEHYFAVRPELLRTLRSGDPMVRYRAALVAAHGGEPDLESWVPVLIQALAEDDIVANAMGASRVLAMRPATRPWVEDVRAGGTPQQRSLARRILAVQYQVLVGRDPGLAWRVDLILANSDAKAVKLLAPYSPPRARR